MLSIFLRATKAPLLLTFVGILFLTTGCEEEQIDDEVHTDADGFILENEEGTEVYREFEGTKEGFVTLNVNDTLEFFVHFLDHDGNEIEHEEHEEEGEEEDVLSVSGFDASIAIVEVEEHVEGEEEDHGAAIHVIGVATGSTDFKLQLMHGDHADYTSTNNVPVNVN